MIDNPVLQTMRSRFSCRSFDSSREVEEEKIRAVLDAAKHAPSGMNAQGWHFTVLRTQHGRELLLQAAGENPPEGFTERAPGADWPFQGDFCGAPVVILISGRPDLPWPDVGAHLSAGNIMNGAASLGLATLWSTAFTKDLFRDAKSREVRGLLIPEGNEVYAALFLGYPKEVPTQRPPRRENVETWL